jgi:hypothetical protein
VAHALLLLLLACASTQAENKKVRRAKPDARAWPDRPARYKWCRPAGWAGGGAETDG